LAEQAKILVAEAKENNLGAKVLTERFRRWRTCSLCEQGYHGVVRGALGWACWKTYLGRPEADWARGAAMTELGTGLFSAGHHEDALAVREANLSLKQRLGASEESILITQGNLATTYQQLGRLEEAMLMQRKVYSGRLKLNGEEHYETLREANNYASILIDLERFEEVESLLRKEIPVARRVLGESQEVTLQMRWNYAISLYEDPDATLDDLHEAVNTLEDTAQSARRVLGGAHPIAAAIEQSLRKSRAALDARETVSA